MIIDLPMPPSVNSIWKPLKTGKSAIVSTKKYKRWQEECNALCLQFRWHKQKISGPFAVWIIFDKEHRSSDLDNLPKGVMDFLHRAGITDDDSMLETFGAEWGFAPVGCRVLVESWTETAEAAE